MKSAKHKVLVALLVVCIVLGYAPTALAGTQIHVTLSSTDHVIRVEAQLSFDPEPWVCARQGGSNLYKVSDDSQFVTNDILYIEVFFDNGTSQKYYNPSAASGPYFEPGNESGGTLNVDIDVVMPPTTGTVTITKVQADGSDDFSADLEFTVTLTDGVHNYSSDKLTVNNPVTLDDVVPGTYTVTETLPVTNWGTPVIEVDGVATNQLTVAAGGTYEVTITNSYDAPQSTLTVVHQVWDTDIVLRTDDPITKDVGDNATVYADDFSGYDLKEGEDDSYTHTFTATDYTHTFWYVESGSDPFGSITVNKEILEGSDEFDSGKLFSVTVTGPDYNETKTVGAGYSVMFSGLWEGTFTVTEEHPGEGWANPVYTTQTVVIGEDNVYNYTVTITNFYKAPDPELGSLKVIKLLDDDGDDYDGDQKFKIYIRPASQTLAALDEETWPRWAELEIGDDFTFTNLEPGLYEVFEEDLPVNWAWTNPDGISYDEIYVEAGANPYPVRVYNKYTAPELGNITVVKLPDETSDRKTGDEKFKIGIRPADLAPSALDESWPRWAVLELGGDHNFDELEPGWYEIFEVDLPANWQQTNPEGRSYVVYVQAGNNDPVTVYNKYTAPEPPPPPPPTSTLTVYYKEWGTDDNVHAPTSHSGFVGSSQVVNAFEVEGYELREGQPASYTHEFSSGNATYTFWYETIIPDEPPPLAPTGGISATMMYGIGVSLLGLGLATKKRER